MRRSPVIVGTAAVAILVGLVTVEAPLPGPLARVHGKLDTVWQCSLCHTDEGIAAGCLDCHREIERQLRDGHGYHRDKPECVTCHPEHHGKEFDLMGDIAWADKEAFDHGHVEFGLVGSHTQLKCAACHKRRSFLGLRQTCTPCHKVQHGPRYPDCEACHGQEKFVPVARFDHSRFPLTKGHQGVDCARCHTGFAQARGKECADCHDSPHRTDWGAACVACHDTSRWSDARLGVSQHALTGFSLAPQHEKVSCDLCHEPGRSYAVRFASKDADNCQACHEDVHAGQFGNRSCLACHDRVRFDPHHFTRADHAAVHPLEAAHAKARCDACHRTDPETRVRRFAGVAKNCASCHKDAHAGQFGQRSCSVCHDQERFENHHFTRRDHDVIHTLRGAHAEAHCHGCHKRDPATKVRSFAGVPNHCGACHKDVHAGQFPGDCAACHTERRFVPSTYGLDDHGSFALRGSHRAIACAACHEREKGVTRFRGTSHACRDCHTTPHGGQFARETRRGDCSACHRADASTFAIEPFDHSKHPLRGAHAKARCGQCHEERNGIVRYRGTPARCDACHTDPHRGQFRKSGATDCQRCHASNDAWAIARFDHNRKTRFKLDGTHANVACSKCHPAVKQPDRTVVVQYRPLGKECKDCHGTR